MVVEMRMIRCMCGCMRLERIGNEAIGLTEDMAHDRSLWRYRIKVVGHR